MTGGADLRTRLVSGVLPIIVLTAVALASGIVSDQSFAGRKKISPHKLTILFTGDDLGNIKGCG